ncbi:MULTISPECIES: transcription termination/antitermination protein NusG [Pirellulaceae]|uniref:transcription termination/antitermination protein NusG n=1 Tax=Pirellulaceae TaxID=2691357 RepID=UPI001E4B2646|nr:MULTISPECIES: transcription termination/antitermination protein NusG [Pirellulaceae]
MVSSADNSFDPQKDPEDSEIQSEPNAVPEDAADETVGGDEAAAEVAEEVAAGSEASAEPVADESRDVPAGEPVTEEKPAAASGRKRGPIEEITEEDEAAEEAAEKDWYILKVQSNREKSICANLIRRVKMAGLEDYFGEILVPTEDLVEYKNGKKKVTKQKLYPGYIVVHMAINDETWFVVRETGGIGDFTGAGGKPVPMLPHEVDRIVKKTRKPDEGEQEEVKTNIRFKIGDHVRITEGTFENFEGDVEVIDETNGRVTVMINIFGRTTPVEMEHWQMEPV